MTPTYEQCLAELGNAKTARAKAMPTEHDCLAQMFQAYQRMKELGWKDGRYAPKDGTVFEVIEVGSTGIFDCSYCGEWPDGHWMLQDGGDIYPSSSIPPLYRLKAMKASA